MSEAPDFETRIVCLKCGREGRATWTRNNPQRHYARRTATSPIATCDAFYLRVNKSPTSNPHIVCGRCGAVHRDDES
jgi:hypothetical protein